MVSDKDSMQQTIRDHSMEHWSHKGEKGDPGEGSREIFPATVWGRVEKVTQERQKTSQVVFWQ